MSGKCSQNRPHAEAPFDCARLNTKNTMFLIIDCSCKIDYKMILIGNYTCSRSINEKSHLCLANACDFSLILLEPCNFLYKLDKKRCPLPLSHSHLRKLAILYHQEFIQKSNAKIKASLGQNV